MTIYCLVLYKVHYYSMTQVQQLQDSTCLILLWCVCVSIESNNLIFCLKVVFLEKTLIAWSMLLQIWKWALTCCFRPQSILFSKIRSFYIVLLSKFFSKKFFAFEFVPTVFHKAVSADFLLSFSITFNGEVIFYIKNCTICTNCTINRARLYLKPTKES